MASATPLISIVIATLNERTNLPAAIDSVAAQTLTEKELIVIDGGSADGTAEVLRERRSDVDCWISEPDRGYWDAWNKGLRRARGEWISFIGADDRLAHPDALRWHAEAAHRGDFDLICSRGVLLDRQGRPAREFGGPWDWRAMKRKQCYCHPGSWRRRRLYERHGEFAGGFGICADYEFDLRHGDTIRAAYVDKATIFVSAFGLSRRRRFRTLLEMARIQSRHPEIGSWRAAAHIAVPMVKQAILECMRLAGYEYI
ncbi:MAG: PGL/p-HBAD biosynthesis glycosyltransferase [candidate division BRC1 bacterium ADurb.BinA364]|nr:MAG: PGL/p-HBAD biosynthesis glycosyltransferase [candidate division BRC1 bacterium ADurb.BinA364]